MQVLTHFPFLKALGWALFNSLWQMAALWLLNSLLMAIFQSAAARIRHSLALTFLSLGAIWTGMTFFATLLVADINNNTWLTFLSPAQSAPGWFWQTTRSFMDAILEAGSSLYLLILSGLIVRYSGHYWHTRKLTRKGLTAMPAEFRVFVTTTAMQLGIRKPVRAWLSSRINVPLTLGFLKPVILVPIAMMSRLTPQQVEAILIHELAHIQRRDYLLHLVVTLLEGLFFFNPFTRLLIRQLKKEREHSCDDMVLQFKYDPHAYVSALLSLASPHQPVQKLAVAATGGSDKWLLERARRILLQKEGNRSRPDVRSITLLLFTALITTLALCKPLLPVHKPVSTAARPSHAATPPSHIVTIALSSTAASPHAITPTATEREISFNHSIHSGAPSISPAQPPQSGLPAPRSQKTRPGNHSSPEPDFPDPDADNLFVNTSDDAVNADDAPGTDSHDYSLNMPSTFGGPSITIQQGAPIVPNSSFSYQYTLGDSSQPEEERIYLQETAQREVLAAIANLQLQTSAQLKELANLRAKAAESVHLRRQIQARQQKIQLDYIKKIATWQHKLEKATRIKVIVYI